MKNTKICMTHKEFLIEGIACQTPSSQEPRSLSQFGICGGCICKEVCNGGVACSLLKIGSLEETIIASLFHSGFHSGTIFCGKNDVMLFWGTTGHACLTKKGPKKFMMPN